jgi:heat shock protein HtpX
MVAALEALQRAHQPAELPSQVAAMAIRGGVGHGLKRLLMTHPPLEERIEVLRAGF